MPRLAGLRSRLGMEKIGVCSTIRSCLLRQIKMFAYRFTGGMSAEMRQRQLGRGGLTILEFLTCTTAVVGGAWLGALFLGVDVRHLAFTALSESKLLDKVPADFRPANPNEKIMTREQLLTTLHEELGSLRNQIATLRTGNAAGASADNAQQGAHNASPE